MAAISTKMCLNWRRHTAMFRGGMFSENINEGWCRDHLETLKGPSRDSNMAKEK